jgi:hypothetical protein
MNQVLGLELKRWPSDATFLYLFRCAEDLRHPRIQRARSAKRARFEGGGHWITGDRR